MTRTVVKALFGIAFMALRASAAEPPSVLSVAPENSSAPAHPAEPPPVSIRRVGPPPRENLPDIHPAVPLLDDAGNQVLHSGRPLSLMRSCGRCHDTAFIAGHNYHSLVGLDEFTRPGEAPLSHPWDSSPGMFGRWDPFVYRWLSPPGATRLDLGTAEWIQRFGARHVGGGPAEHSRIDGKPLDRREPADPNDPDSHVLDPATGQPRLWDWKASGTVELNCLLCHARNPDNEARIQTLRQGRFSWASTATLLQSGLVARNGDGFAWKAENFNPDGTVSAERLGLGWARTENCMQCHGRACRCVDPVVFQSSRDNWAAETTGAVFSPARVRASGMNLHDKNRLNSAWDVHAERLVTCANCHHAPNNPAYDRKQEAGSEPPSHLLFDARRADEKAYLYRPDHDLVKGDTAQGTVARRFNGTMRECRDCHDAEAVHAFLPFPRTHFARLDCASCHIPEVWAPTRESTDWTLLGPDREPLKNYRGVAGPVDDSASLLTGQVPALLIHESRDGVRRLQPHSLHTAWFWVEGDPPHPVRRLDLERALFAEGGYHPAVIAALDDNGDGTLSAAELRLDNPTKVAAVAARLTAVGVDRPRIQAEIQPFTMAHAVVDTTLAVRDCAACHSAESRVSRPITLASFAPGGVLPVLVGDASTALGGAILKAEDGRVLLQPVRQPIGMYVHGAEGVNTLDIAGLLLVAGVVVGSTIHGGLRFATRRRRGRSGGNA